MKTYFISGHLDLTLEEFNIHYIPLINKAIEENSSFVIGDAKGADSMAQEYLKTFNANVKVYHMFSSSRNNCGYETVGGFSSDKERDEALTRDSTHDIAWVRPGREKSGTAKNLKRRKL